jgi:general stress protein 26
MPTEIEITRKFWSALRSDMTVMLGQAGTDTKSRPMTAQLHPDDEDDEGDHRGPIWFFTSADASLAGGLGDDAPAFFTFTSKGGDVFAHVTGRLRIDTDRSIIDDLWNPFVAAWYEGGKDDPDLVLLRFDPASAEVWLDGSSILAGLKVLLGRKPQQEYSENIAKIAL